MKFGVYLGRAHPNSWRDLAVAADSLGFESLWIPEHLILPEAMTGSPITGHAEPPITPDTPTYDALGYLTYLAGCTQQIRLGTWVYVLALRHPFVAARSIQTLDIVSGGRALIGVGAGWLREEWDAAGVEFSSRGRRLDEALEICRRLWTQKRTSFSGEFFQFDAVAFEPKTIQQPHPPIFIGGESDRALRRAAHEGDGWMGMNHDFNSAAPLLSQLSDHRDEIPDRPFEMTVGVGHVTALDVEEWTRLGIDRLIVTPWESPREAIAGVGQFAQEFGLRPGGGGMAGA